MTNLGGSPSSYIHLEFTVAQQPRWGVRRLQLIALVKCVSQLHVHGSAFKSHGLPNLEKQPDNWGPVASSLVGVLCCSFDAGASQADSVFRRRTRGTTAQIEDWLRWLRRFRCRARATAISWPEGIGSGAGFLPAASPV
eukprot:2462666-Rhodomonas_salina.2